MIIMFFFIILTRLGTPKRFEVRILAIYRFLEPVLDFYRCYRTYTRYRLYRGHIVEVHLARMSLPFTVSG